ncbi:hypothetical protein LTR37_018651, partial [Vermiconidia calcicola]
RSGRGTLHSRLNEWLRYLVSERLRRATVPKPQSVRTGFGVEDLDGVVGAAEEEEFAAAVEVDGSVVTAGGGFGVEDLDGVVDAAEEEVFAAAVEVDGGVVAAGGRFA